MAAIYLLTAPATEITAPSGAQKDSDELTVYLVQDEAGGRQISWAAGFEVATEYSIRAEPNSVSVFHFGFRAGKWWVVAVPRARSGTGCFIHIDAVADSFKWRRGEDAWTEGLPITGSSQDLLDGVTISFGGVVRAGLRSAAVRRDQHVL